jgi:muramidase (phage lysozyme)
MDVNVIKSYLIKLGADVNVSSFDKFKTFLKDAENAIKKSAGVTTSLVFAGASSVAAALVLINEAIAKNINKVAQADMQYQLLAQKMFMNVNAAKAYSIATDAIGHSLHEIAWNAELKHQYFMLVKDVNDLKVPPEAKDMFKGVRAIDFEIKRIKTMIGLGMEHIAAEILKINGGDLKSFYKWLHEFADWIKENIPEWSKKIAHFLNPFIIMLQSIYKLFKALYDLFMIFVPAIKMIFSGWKQIADLLPAWIVGLGLLWAALRLIFLPTSPIMMGIAAFLALALLVDDAMAFKEGRESLKSLTKVWQAFTDFGGFLCKLAIAGIILWEEFWKAVRGEQALNTIDTWKKIREEQAAFDRSVDEDEAKRDRKRAENIRKRQAKEKGIPYVPLTGDEIYGKKFLPGGDSSDHRSGGAEGSFDIPGGISSTGDAQKDLFKLITEKGEGTAGPKGYDISLGNGTIGDRNHKPLTEMNFDELYDFQTSMLRDRKNKWNSSASGKYQFVQETLFGKKGQPGLLKELGIKQSEKFTPEMQDRLAAAYIADAVKKFKAGLITKAQFQNIMSGKWDSVAAYGSTTSVKGHRATVTTAMLNPIIDEFKQAPGTPSPAQIAAKAGTTTNITNNANVTINAHTNNPEELAAKNAAATKKALEEHAAKQNIQAVMGT